MDHNFRENGKIEICDYNSVTVVTKPKLNLAQMGLEKGITAPEDPKI